MPLIFHVLKFFLFFFAGMKHHLKLWDNLGIWLSSLENTLTSVGLNMMCKAFV